MKTLPCYAFGLAPSAVSERVAAMCNKADVVGGTDFSKFDGSIGVILRLMEITVYLRLFKPERARVLAKLYSELSHLRARCSLGTVYDTDNSRCSGGPDTSISNTLSNMFTTFVSFRCSTSDGTFMDADEAFARMMEGLFGGDDGLTPALQEAAYSKACKMLGLVAKLDLVHRGQMGVSFLARIYGPDVWHNDPSNCADIRRQLGKLHVCVSRPDNVSPEEILSEKMIGFALTDANTPILGPFAKKVMELSPNYVLDIDSANNNVSYLARQGMATYADSDTVVFHNEPREWYKTYVANALPEFNQDAFLDWVRGASSVSELLTAPRFSPEHALVVHPEYATHINGAPISFGTFPPQPPKPEAKIKRG